MRDIYCDRVERGRVLSGRLRSRIGDPQGAFRIRPRGRWLTVLASTEGDWDHVSVSLEKGRGTPTWLEMDAVKRLFFRPDEWAVQYHPSVEAHTTYGSKLGVEVLHLWAPKHDELPVPPKWMV